MTVFGIKVLILGLLAIACPLTAGAAVSTMVAILLMAAGAVRMLWAFKAGSFGKGALVLLLGGLTLGVGIVMLARPLVVLASLTIVLAVYFLLDGISEIVAAFSVKPAKGWGFMVFGGAMSILLSSLILVSVASIRSLGHRYSRRRTTGVCRDGYDRSRLGDWNCSGCGSSRIPLGQRALGSRWRVDRGRSGLVCDLAF